jgi:hypothetical protein
MDRQGDDDVADVTMFDSNHEGANQHCPNLLQKIGLNCRLIICSSALLDPGQIGKQDDSASNRQAVVSSTLHILKKQDV